MSYPVTNMTYNDADQLLTHTYPDGDVVTNTFGSQGWLSSVSNQVGSLISNIGYTGPGGAVGLMTVASLTGTYSLANSYDLLARATEIKVTKSADGTTRFDQVRTFDTGGNRRSAMTSRTA